MCLNCFCMTKSPPCLWVLIVCQCTVSVLEELNLFLYFKAYLSRDEAQAMIAHILAEKDTLRSQLVELQESVFSLQAKPSPREQQHSSDVLFQHLSEHIETQYTQKKIP